MCSIAWGLRWCCLSGAGPLTGSRFSIASLCPPSPQAAGLSLLAGRKRVPSTAAALPRVFQSSGTGMRDRRAGSEQEGDTAGGGRVCWGVLESRQRLEVGAAQVPVGAHPPAEHFQFPRTSLPLGLGPGRSCAPQGQGSPGAKFSLWESHRGSRRAFLLSLFLLRQPTPPAATGAAAPAQPSR